jgi:hypothetical protein
LYKLVFLIISLVFTSILSAQNERVIRTIAPKSEWQNAYALSYFAPLVTNPGVRAEYQYCFQKMQKEVKYTMLDYFLGTTNKNKSTIKIKERLFTNGTAFYYDHNNHSAFMLTTAYTVRKHKKRMFTERNIGLGVMRSFLPKTYKVDNNGAVSRVRFAGNIMMNPYYSYGLFFKDNKRENVEFFLRGSLYFYIPYNHTFNMNTMFEAGYRIILTK